MRAQEQAKITREEYLELERDSKIKHEYFDGEIFAMTGAKPNHNRIQHNISGILWNQMLESPCEAFLSDQRVKIEAIEKYIYPDVSAACDKVEFDGDSPESLLNPVVIIEILSDSTEAYDRGVKFEHYQLIPSLQEYILVSQDRCRVEKFVRSGDGSWNYTAFTNMEQTLKVDSIKCELNLSEIYRRVEFEG